MTEYDIVVIGGGAAGLVSSGVLAHLGARVCLVEKTGELGGECLHTGCVPSKALLAVARQWHEAGRTAHYGLPALDRGTVDLQAIMGRVQRVVAGIQEHETVDMVKAEHVEDVKFGEASFIDAYTVRVGDENVRAKKFVLCTGSRPFVPPIEGMNANDVLTNETIFSLSRLPERLAVLGGGPIGLEMAQAFARLGSRVTVIEMLDRILPQDDPELTVLLRSQLEAEGVQFRLNSQVVRAARGQEWEIVLRHDEEEHTVHADEFLVAAGRRANVESLNLDAAGVRVERSGVYVDGNFRTTARNIWGLGDVNGRYPFSHMAEAEGRAASRNIAFGLPSGFRKDTVAWATFTEPELASVGLTEEQARKKHRRVRVLRFGVDRVDRALADGHESGLVKVVIAGWTGRVVGAQILSAHAGELIQEWILAVEHKLKASQISGAVHVYPTFSLLNQRAADGYFREWSERGWVRSWVARAYRWLG